MCEIKLDLKDYKGAKIYADKADECCRTNKENYFLGDWASFLDRVNEHIRTTSQNVFVFLKAFPLIDPSDQKQIGPITQKHNKFKETVLKNMKSEHKVIQVKFDTLTRENLAMIKTHGCRVLHLSSEEAKSDQLWAEGKLLTASTNIC